MKIALICSLGLSTSLLLTKMEAAAEKQNLQHELVALGSSELSEEAEGVDVFLLAPQVRYMIGTVQKYGKPVAVLDGMIYALANGEKALEVALQLAAESGGAR
ncbi:MAG: hypothetical protein WCC10_01135 [Tumebacillaceae bacterium]